MDALVVLLNVIEAIFFPPDHCDPELGILAPPAEYVGQKGEKTILFRYLPAEDLEFICSRFGTAGAHYNGCAIVVGDACAIFMDKSLPFTHKYWCLAKHEIGHCHGWPASHPTK